MYISLCMHKQEACESAKLESGLNESESTPVTRRTEAQLTFSLSLCLPCALTVFGKNVSKGSFVRRTAFRGFPKGKMSQEAMVLVEGSELCCVFLCPPVPSDGILDGLLATTLTT